MEETKLRSWAEGLKELRLPRWEELPELELYMDQVITLVDRYLSPLIEDEKHQLLSSAMVNNYVKHKLVGEDVHLTRRSDDFYYLAMESAVASFTQKMLAEKIIQLDQQKEGENDE